MSKPSAVRQDARHVAQRPVNSLAAPPTDKKPAPPVEVQAAVNRKDGCLDPTIRTVHLVFWWKTAPDPLLTPRIAQTDNEWRGEWFSMPHPIDVWNEQHHEWTVWWMASYALPLTARVVRELERIRTLPQEEW